MVFYTRDITTSADRSEAEALETPFKLSAGIIHRVEVIFPRGCAGLLHVTIWHGGHQLYPGTEEQEFVGDGETVSFNDYYELRSEINLLKVKTWNEDEIFTHDCTVRIGIMKPEEINPWIIVKELTNVIKTLVGMD